MKFKDKSEQRSYLIRQILKSNDYMEPEITYKQIQDFNIFELNRILLVRRADYKQLVKEHIQNKRDTVDDYLDSQGLLF